MESTLGQVQQTVFAIFVYIVLSKVLADSPYGCLIALLMILILFWGSSPAQEIFRGFFDDDPENTILKFIDRIRLFTNKRFQRAVAELQRDDLICLGQNTGYGELHFPNCLMRRRLRMLYEKHKISISPKRRKPSYLRHDIGVGHEEKFFRLIDYLGRKRLRDQLKEIPPITACYAWDGKERRRRRGVKRDRSSPDSKDSSERCDDNEILREKIQNGTLLR